MNFTLTITGDTSTELLSALSALALKSEVPETLASPAAIKAAAPVTKKEPKIQGERPIPILFSLKCLRSAAEKIVVRTLSPKAAALLPTYAKLHTLN